MRIKNQMRSIREDAVYVEEYDSHFARTCSASKDGHESSDQCQEANSNGGIRVSPIRRTYVLLQRAHTIVRGVVVKFQFSHIAISTTGGNGVSSPDTAAPARTPGIWQRGPKPRRRIDTEEESFNLPSRRGNLKRALWREKSRGAKEEGTGVYYKKEKLSFAPTIANDERWFY